MIHCEVRLSHQVAADVLAAQLLAHAHPTDVGALELTQGHRQRLQRARHMVVDLAGDIQFVTVYLIEIKVDERLRVLEGVAPELFRLSLTLLRREEVGERLLLHENVLLEQDVGFVAQFGKAQSLIAHVLFAVHVEILFGQMLHKLLIDNGKGTVVACVGLLHADVEGAVVDGATKGERHQAALHPDASATQVEFVPEAECPRHRPQLMLLTLAWLLLARPPLVLQPQTFGNHVRRQLAVFILVLLTESVGMVALALQFLSRQREELLARVDVVGKVAVGVDLEDAGQLLLDDVGHIVADAEHQERMAHGDGIVA